MQAALMSQIGATHGLVAVRSLGSAMKQYRGLLVMAAYRDHSSPAVFSSATAMHGR